MLKTLGNCSGNVAVYKVIKSDYEVFEAPSDKLLITATRRLPRHILFDIVHFRGFQSILNKLAGSTNFSDN